MCGDCGEYMRPKTNKRLDENGNKTFSYLCETKEKSRRELCQMKNPQGNLLDQMVCDEIKKIVQNEDRKILFKQLNQAKRQLLSKETSYSTELDHLEKALSDTEKKIENLVLALSQSSDSPAFAYINNQISVLHEQKLEIEKQIEYHNKLLQDQNSLLANFNILIKKLSSFPDSFDMMSIEEKRTVLRALVDKVVWDGTHAHLYFTGSIDENTKPQRGDCK
ncbi:MAG: zinc ribbon domain-containing protein [Eubacteriales bacterium]|nr:zinc ribbon domain-containing protein [Eubacteriales bacterium]